MSDPQTSKYEAMRRLLREFAPNKGKVALVLVLGLVVSSIQPVAVKLSQVIIDSLGTLKEGGVLTFKNFLWIPPALIVIFLVNGFGKYFHSTVRRLLANKVIFQLRHALFEKHCHLPLAVIDTQRTGDMLSHVQNDLHQMNAGVETVTDAMKEPFTFLGLMGVALYCNWRLTLCTLLVVPIVVLLFSRTGAAVKRYSKRNLDELSDLLSLSQEALVGARVVKVFRLENVLSKKFSDVHDRYFGTAWKSVRVQELGTPVVEFVGALLMAGVITFGAYEVVAGRMTPGALVAFVLAIGLCQQPIKQLNNIWMKMKHAEAAAERVYAMLDRPDSRTIAQGYKHMSGFKEKIVYDDVSLRYGDKFALNHVSFEVARGECVAFVGHSGGGKSSIVNLLPRLYEISGGRILIDGHDIRELCLGDLRGLISFVTQDTFLFHDTIFENIRYGRPSASSSEIERAAQLAHCLDFVEKSPKGFDTIIGDRGVCLSGGERQRVAIARAILKGAPILVLDEATSSLDSKSEGIVQVALEALMKDKTSFMVAHRLSTIRKASKIIVVEGGQIQEAGTHGELISKRGGYSSLFQTQFEIPSDATIQ